MSSKEKHHHRHSSMDTKGQAFGRNVIAFFLFISITVLSLSVCAKVCFVNPVKYAEIFTNQKYVNSLYEDVKQYAYDMCDEASIPTDSVDEIITYSSIYEIGEAYAYGNLTSADEYTQTTYDDRIDELKNDLVDSTNQMVKSYNLSTDGSVADGVNLFALKVTDYVRSKVTFNYMDKLQTVVNLGKTISVVLIVVFSIVSIVLALITFSIGNKRHRGLRAVVYSFNASALIQLGFVLAAQIIKHFKTLVIYPTYLCESVMRFVNSCILYVAISAGFSVGVALIIITAVWKLKRNENKHFA